MSKSNHTEAQMIGALKQLEAGRKAEDVAREVGVSKHTIYAWKAKYGGMDVSQAQEAKQLRGGKISPTHSHKTRMNGAPGPFYFCTRLSWTNFSRSFGSTYGSPLPHLTGFTSPTKELPQRSGTFMRIGSR